MKRKQDKAGFTLMEILTAIPVAVICIYLVFTLVWNGTRLVTRNFSINLAHLNVVSPMQGFIDDIHMSMVSPQLTGPLANGAGGGVPSGYSGGANGSVKAFSMGKMTGWSLPVVTGSGPAEGVQLYLMASSQYAVSGTFGSYNGSASGFPVANGSYLANASTLNLEVATTADEMLLASATNGMRLCIPAVCSLISGSNYSMFDRKITNVTFSGAIASGTANTRIASCTLSGTIGTVVQSAGTRSTSSSPVLLAYLVTPVNYFICGTDLIRLNYDGNWRVLMRNVLPTNLSWTQAKPFSMPWPYTQSFLSTTVDGRRAVKIRLTSSNPDYTTVSGTNKEVNDASNLRYRGAGADMLLYDIVIWSRMQLFDEVAR